MRPCRSRSPDKGNLESACALFAVRVFPQSTCYRKSGFALASLQSVSRSPMLGLRRKNAIYACQGEGHKEP